MTVSLHTNDTIGENNSADDCLVYSLHATATAIVGVVVAMLTVT